MKFFGKILFVLLFGCFSTHSFAQYIQVNDTFTAQQLVENELINNPCANVSNFTVSGNPDNAGEQSYGYFYNGNSNFPFADGIVLCTSRATRASGPNDNLIDEGLTTWLGDSDLEQALNITNTLNATVLEFDFVPLTDKISFDYLFASEEYQGTAPCKYSDGFAFLLKEANTNNPYQNLAIIPNTTTPVLVTNVHPEIPGSCPASNENYFGGYNGTDAPINYNGQTTVLKAETTVIPGTTYHIKLVIADHENTRYDSAIFLDLNHFNTAVDLGADRLISTKNPICEGESTTLDATTPGNNSYKWFKDKIEIIGAKDAKYTVKETGVYTAEITLGTSSACKSTDDITIEYSPLPTLKNTTLVQCDADKNGRTIFNLSKANDIIKNNDPSLGNVVYYENIIDAQNQNLSQAIANPTSYESAPKTIYASVSNAIGCSNVATLLLQISNAKVSSSHDLESCDLDGVIDGYYGFDLSMANSKMLSGLPTGLVVEYYETMDDALTQTNILPNIYRNTTRYKMTIYGRIINGSDCYGIIPLRLYANSLTPRNFGDETITLCEGNSVSLQVDQIYKTYSWSNGDKVYTTKVKNPGEYTVTVSDNNTCQATKKFTVIPSGKATITAIDINDFQENSNSILIHITDIRDYEFSIDGINYQDSPYFENVLTGQYTVRVRDKNGCGETTKKIYVLNYPKYFTPNGDGYNDVWSIENITVYPKATISIFDRFGKIIYEFLGNKKGWDGKLNSIDLPSTDYWFVITLDNERIIKGHFALKR